MKKRTNFIAAVLALIIAIPLEMTSLSANSHQIQLEKITTDNEKIICTATLNDDFSEDTIIVTMKNPGKRKLKKYTKGSFGIGNIVSFKDLTPCNGDIENRPDIDADHFRQIFKLTIKSKNKKDVLDTIKKLEKHKDVLAVEPDYILKAPEPVKPVEAAPRSVATQYNLSKVQAQEAWKISKGAGVKVAVIDTGIDHSSGYFHIDTAASKNFYDSTSPLSDQNGHGTHVAGIIASNSSTATGIAPDATLISYKVAGSNGTGLFSASIEALSDATTKNIPIVNYSRGSDDATNTGIRAAIQNYPGLFVCAAGNKGIKINGSNSGDPHMLTLHNMLQVANSTSSDTLNSGSNYGTPYVHLAAPGTSIYSTVPGDFDYKTGTSMAAPLVAGVAALVESKYKGLTAQQKRQMIVNSVDKVSALNGKVTSGGRLNAKKAVEAARDYKSMVLSGDFNGDGKDDVAELAGMGAAGSQFVVRLSTGSSFGLPKSWFESHLVFINDFWERAAVGDFNGDGKDDIAVMYYYSDKSTKLLVYLSNGSNFYGQTWQSWEPNMFQADKVTGRFAAGDVNGDGKDDIVTMYDYGNSKTKIFAHISNGSKFTGSSEFQSWNAGLYNANSVTGRFACGDVNGDGKDDLTVMYDYGNNAKIFTYLSSGTKFSGSQEWWSNAYYGPGSITNRFAMGDLNGDGKDDLAVMYYYPDHRTNIFTYLSTGSKFDGSKDWRSWPAGYYPADNVSHKFAMGDFNKDGKEDIVTLYHYSEYKAEGNNHLHTFISTGNGLNQSTWSTK